MAKNETQAQQFSFEVKSKATGRNDHVRCTHETVEMAYAAVLNYYGTGFEVNPQPVAIKPAHYYLGEINCI